MFHKILVNMATKLLQLPLWGCWIFALALRAQTTNYVYISDAGNFNQPPWQILRFDENGENGKVFIADHLAWPQDILFLEDKNEVLISNLNTGRISKFNAETGAFLSEFATGIGGPTRMKVGPDSLLYVLQWQGTGKVRRYRLNGTFVDQFTALGVPNSIGLDWDRQSNLYVSSYNGRYVRKFSPTGADLGIFANTNLAGPTNIWFNEQGELLVVDYEGGGVKRFDAQGKYLGVFIEGLPNGEGVAVLPNGDLLVGSGGTSSVRVYSPSGTFLRDLVPSKHLNLLTPNAVILRPQKATPVQEPTIALAMAAPSVGRFFRFLGTDVLQPNVPITVYDATGALIQTLHIGRDTAWDAYSVPAGSYWLTARLADGRLARQQVVVTKP